MKKRMSVAVLGACALFAQKPVPRVYIEPQGGFESYISAAIIKKHTPVVITQNRDTADFVLTSSVVTKQEGAASKIARCLFVYCIGMEGLQSATGQLVSRSGDVAWAYSVRKEAASPYQSTAEAVAKHLKDFLEKR